jgi:hypothetical protein
VLASHIVERVHVLREIRQEMDAAQTHGALATRLGNARPHCLLGVIVRLPQSPNHRHTITTATTHEWTTSVQ